MPITLALASGLRVENAVEKLRLKFQEWPWERYDGVPVADLNRISLADVNRVYQLGARSPRRAYLSFIEQSGRRVSRCLSAIPTDMALESERLILSKLREPITRLFNLLMAAKHIKLAGATKLISPFRPALLPVIDSVLENYYWYATSISDEASFRRLEHAHETHETSPGEYVFALLELIRKDVRDAARTIDRIRASFRGEPIEKIPRVRVLESLIWFHYARGRSLRE